jgi:hypothetical protein
MSESTTEDDKPPLFDSWKGWYTIVLSVLAIQIILYYVLTRVFS